MWTSAKGPPGSLIADVTAHPTDPDILMATVDGGGDAVYKSTDGGRTWSGSSNGITTPFGWKVYFDPSDESGNTVYVTTWVGGLYRSLDGGTSWQFVDGTPNSHAWVMAFSHNNPNNIYLAGYAGVYKSSDGGKTWDPIKQDIRPFSIATAPENDGLVYVGSWSVDQKIYRSRDGGASWIALTNGLPNANFYDIVAIGNGIVAYAATDLGVYKTTDGGDFWFQASEGLGDPVRNLDVSRDNPLTLYAATDNGIFVSTDGAGNWQPSWTDQQARFAKSVEIDPARSNHVFASLWQGVAQTDGTSSMAWSLSNSGLPNIAMVIDGALAIKPTTPHMMMAGTFGGGVYRTSIDQDGSIISNWESSHGTEGLIPAHINAGFAGNTWTGKYVYMGTDGHGVYRSEDNGLNWESIGPSDSNIATIAIGNRDNEIYIGSEDGNFRSFDSGDTFTPIPNLPPWAVAFVFDPNDDNRIFAATWENGVFRSEDGGSNWTPLTAGLSPSLQLRSLAMDPNNPQILFLGTQESGIYKTTDGGENWFNVGGPLSESGIQFIHIDSRDSSIIYAGTRLEGIYRSTDNGNTWSAWNEGLPEGEIGVQTIVPASFDENILYIGTSKGVYFKNIDTSS